MQKLDQLHAGEGKGIFATESPDIVLVEYRDDARAYGGLKRGRITGKGVINNRMTNYLMCMLEKQGEATCFIGEVSERESLMRRVDIVPLEIIVRNVAAGSISERLGLPEGAQFHSPIVELCYKSEELDDPIVNETHIAAMHWCDLETVRVMKERSLRINGILREYFKKIKVELIDMKLEFGYDRAGHLLLTEELDPDTFRLWDSETHERLDKDRFRRDLGGAEEAYQEIWSRLQGE